MFQRILVSTTEWNELLSRIILVKLYFQWEYILINEWDCKMSTRLKSNDGQGLYQQFRWNEQGKLNILYPEFLEGTVFSDQFSWNSGEDSDGFGHSTHFWLDLIRNVQIQSCHSGGARKRRRSRLQPLERMERVLLLASTNFFPIWILMYRPSLAFGSFFIQQLRRKNYLHYDFCLSIQADTLALCELPNVHSLQFH